MLSSDTLTNPVLITVNLSLLAMSNASTSFDPANAIIAKRNVNALSSTVFEPLSRRQQEINCSPECHIKVIDLKQLDHEYVILIAKEKRLKVGEAVAQEPFSNPAASSIGTTLHRDASMVGTLLSTYFCATVFWFVM
jgi:hypothetical protein